MPKRQMHREVFLAHNGPGPWLCFGCVKPVYFVESFHVHHLDIDDKNNVPENLVSMHGTCHGRLHKTGWRHSEEAKAKIGAAGKGRVISPEHRAAVGKASHERIWTFEMRENIGRAHLGKVVSAETRAKISIAAREIASNPKERERLSTIGSKGAAMRWHPDTGINL